MGIIERQSIINSVVLYVGIVLGFISTIFLYPNILSPEQYGLTRLLLSVSFVFMQFSHLGMKNIGIKFFPYFENKETRHNGFLFLMLSVPLLGFLIVFLFLTFGSDLVINYYKDSSQLFLDYYIYLIPLIFGILYFEVINSYVRALNDSVPGLVISEILIRAASILLLVSLFLEWINFNEFMTGFVLSYMAQPFILLFYLFRKNELYLKPNFSFLNKPLVKEIANYGFYVLLGGMTTLIVNNIDIIMLGSLSGLKNTGIYAIAFYISNVIVVPQKSIGKIAPSLISRHLKNENFVEVKRIYKSSSINQLIPGCLVFIGIWANLDNLISILPEEYASAGLVIIIIGISKLFDMGTGVNKTILLNSEYYRFNLVAISFLVVISVALNYLLIPLYGIVGAAVATATSLFLYNLVNGVYLWLKLSMQPFSSKILVVLALSSAILLLSFQVDKMGSIYSDIFIRSSLITLFFSTGIIVFNVSEEVSNIWLSTKKKISDFFP